MVAATLDWLRDCGIEHVELHATQYAETLYRGLGFSEPSGLALTAWLVP